MEGVFWGRSLTTELHPTLSGAQLPGLLLAEKQLPYLCTLLSPGWSKNSVLQRHLDSDLGAGAAFEPGLGQASAPGLPEVGRYGGATLGLWAPGGQTRESSAWKLEERRVLGLTRVSKETCVLHVAPLLPPAGWWYLEPRPKKLCGFQRHNFRRSSACT